MANHHKTFPSIIFAGHGIDLEINDSNMNHPFTYPSVMLHSPGGHSPESRAEIATSSYHPPPLQIESFTRKFSTLALTNPSQNHPNPIYPYWHTTTSTSKLDLPSIQLLKEQYSYLESKHHEASLTQSTLPQADSLALFSRIHAAYYQHVYLALNDADTADLRNWYSEFNSYSQDPSLDTKGMEFIYRTIEDTPEEGPMGAWATMLEEVVQGGLPGEVGHKRTEEWVERYNTPANQRGLVHVELCPSPRRRCYDDEEDEVVKWTAKRKRDEVDEDEVVVWTTRRVCEGGWGFVRREEVVRENRGFETVFRAVKSFLGNFVPMFLRT